VASKGRFDRARSARQREREGLPHESTLMTDDFMALTLDVWELPPESARRVGHPAPFPVELPEQLIRLYTYADDLVLDPFMGSGSALVAAARLGRRYIGYDLDGDYVEIARRRVAAEGTRPAGSTSRRAIATASGKASLKLAEEVLEEVGFTIVDRKRRIARTGVTVDLVAGDVDGREWFFDVSGAFVSQRGGLQRADVVWRALGRAAAVRTARGDSPLVLLTTDLPRPGSEGALALAAAGSSTITDVVAIFDDDAVERLRRYAKGARP
jgi:site-specific DNA-methyltransferase (adenine-specific)